MADSIEEAVERAIADRLADAGSHGSIGDASIAARAALAVIRERMMEPTPEALAAALSQRGVLSDPQMTQVAEDALSLAWPDASAAFYETTGLDMVCTLSGDYCAMVAVMLECEGSMSELDRLRAENERLREALDSVRLKVNTTVANALHEFAK